jgi:phospholipid/cholesterol/gamma-HCH transport system substrate-binding protein
MKLGIFTFVTGGLLAMVLVVFGGLRFWKHRDRYYIDFTDSVMGLSEGTQVFFNGIKVGGVGEIKLDPDEPTVVRVAIDVDRGTPIHADTVAMLYMAGITGLKVIDLQGGTVKAASLPPGAHIIVGLGVLDKLSKQAERLADQTGEMITRARQIMDGANQIVVGLQGVVVDIHGVVGNVQAITDPKQLGAVIDATKLTAQNLQKASAEVGAMVAENRAAMKSTLTSITQASDNANMVTTDVRTLIRNNQGTIAATLADLRQAARGFKELAREVREKPSRLLLSDSPAERKLP